MKFPAFWFDPEANLFEDVVFFVTGTGAADVRTFVFDVSVNARPDLDVVDSAKLPPPNEI